MTVKAVLIDLDDTFYGYEKCNQYGINAVVDGLSLIFGMPKEVLMELFYKSRNEVNLKLKGTASSHSRFLYIQKTIESLKGKTDIRLIRKTHNLFWNAYLSQMEVFGGVIDFLKQLKRSGIKIAVVTDLTADIQFRKLIKLGLDKYIDFVITSEEAGCDKPAKPIFLCALEKLGLRREDVILIGNDMSKDIKGAKDFGFNYILADGDNFRSILESFKKFL